jgi:hypothetical protein
VGENERERERERGGGVWGKEGVEMSMLRKAVKTEVPTARVGVCDKKNALKEERVILEETLLALRFRFKTSISRVRFRL